MTVCGMLDTLTYLKMGGRIPAALAFLGNTLHIKPVIELKDKKLVMLGKARGRKSAIQCLWKEFEEKSRMTATRSISGTLWIGNSDRSLWR